MGNFPDPASQVFAFPLAGPMHLPLRPQAERNGPPAPLEQRMPFNPQHRSSPFPLPVSVTLNSIYACNYLMCSDRYAIYDRIQTSMTGNNAFFIQIVCLSLELGTDGFVCDSLVKI